MKVSYYYDYHCDRYIRLTVDDGTVVGKQFLEYYYGHTNIPHSGRLTNKTKPATISYLKLHRNLL
jgi:hypothetical protein